MGRPIALFGRKGSAGLARCGGEFVTSSLGARAGVEAMGDVEVSKEVLGLGVNMLNDPELGPAMVGVDGHSLRASTPLSVDDEELALESDLEVLFLCSCQRASRSRSIFSLQRHQRWNNPHIAT